MYLNITEDFKTHFSENCFTVKKERIQDITIRMSPQGTQAKSQWHGVSCSKY